MSPDSATFLKNFISTTFLVGLLQGFMINAHESGSNLGGGGGGLFSRDLTKTKSVVANDWCINCNFILT